MIECYNHSTLEIKNSKADSVAIKGVNIAVKLYDLIQGVVKIDTTDYVVGQYQIQFFVGNQVISTDVLKVKQNLKFVEQSYNPISENKKILEAIKAYLAGRASSQQKQVSVGDKKIIYSSFDQLIKWKNYYQIEVRKEQGKASGLRFEKLYYRGI